MFESFTLIPHTTNELSQTMAPIQNITTQFKNIVSSDNYSMTWFGNYMSTSLASLLTVMDAITATNDKRVFVAYFDNDEYRFNDKFTSTHNMGIIINKAPSTRFNGSNYPGAEYLENAQDFLKQTPHHFLKIFTYKESNYLYVWTNKVIEPDTLYKLFALELSIHNKKNTLLANFINCAIANNIDGARKILTDFFNSDEVIKKEFEIFRKCLANKSASQISKLERDITTYRNKISDYENSISDLATKIRESSEKISFFKYMREEDDTHLLFYKHLKKIPYIKSFTGYDNGYIHLEYEAPLIYFSEYPAERLIAQRGRSIESKNIIKMIIGRKYELITKCALEFNTTSFGISSDMIMNNDNVIKHPHISRYNCFGNHRQAIQESAEAGDYIGAIEQITQAVLNLNFFDVCVIDTLCNDIKNRSDTLATWKCKETGEMLTTTQVLERGDFYEEA